MSAQMSAASTPPLAFRLPSNLPPIETRTLPSLEPQDSLVGQKKSKKRRVRRKVQPMSRPEDASEPEMEFGFTVHWRNLNVTNSTWRVCWRSAIKIVLLGLNGHFRSGEVSVIMGPSGSGKSTLLNCLSGKRKTGVTGEVKISGQLRKPKVGVVPQNEYLLENLTVKESLAFGARLQKVERTESVMILNQFGLQVCAETLIAKCSGGQRKRLSIALEYLSHPNILMLDEPTSGLDTTASQNIIDIMIDLSKSLKPVAVVATIHQPSVTLFNMFHKVFVLSSKGRCVYQGRPGDLVENIRPLGITCPDFYNPADYIIEVASGDYGFDFVNKLINEEKKAALNFRVPLLAEKFKVKKSQKRKENSCLWHFGLLWFRSVLTIYRDKFAGLSRLFSALALALFIGTIYGDSIGGPSSCPPSLEMLYSSDFEVVTSKFRREYVKWQENIAFIFLALLNCMFLAMYPVLLTFPKEMNVLAKEYQNGWYAIGNYYWSKFLAELPIQILLPTIYVSVAYSMTGQPMNPDRLTAFTLIAVVTCLMSQSLGEAIGALFMEDTNAAVYIGGISMLPIFLFGGFLVKVPAMPVYLQPLSWFSFMRYTFELMLISLYGWGRCEAEYIAFGAGLNATRLRQPHWVTTLLMVQKQLEISKRQQLSDEDYFNLDFNSGETDSIPDRQRILSIFGGQITQDGHFDYGKAFVLNFFEIDDSYAYHAMLVLAIHFFVYRFVTFIILKYKLRRKS